MSETQKVWIDVARCTGCGACVAMCPTGAITLADGRARVDEEACTGCGACVDACPEGAIQPVVQGELVPASPQPAPTVYRPGPLARTAGAMIAVAGAGLLVRAAGALAQAMGRWLMRRSAMTRPSAEATSRAAGSTGGGRRARHRRRGQ